jgi:MOSC domain-containing protein YiiM
MSPSPRPQASPDSWGDPDSSDERCISTASAASDETSSPNKNCIDYDLSSDTYYDTAGTDVMDRVDIPSLLELTQRMEKHYRSDETSSATDIIADAGVDTTSDSGTAANESGVLCVFRRLGKGKVFNRVAESSLNITVLEGVAESLDWQKTSAASKYFPLKPRSNDRAVLFQSTKHYSELRERFPQFSSSLTEVRAPTPEKTIVQMFAEQVLVDSSLNCDTVCLGDVFITSSGLELEVTSPRLPCAAVDTVHGNMYGTAGVRQICATNGLAGFFCRVLQAGTLGSGDKLRLKCRPHPQWTMRRLSLMVFGETDARYKVLRWPGTVEEMALLCHPATGLAESNWRERLVPLLKQATVRKSRERSALLLVPLLLGPAIHGLLACAVLAYSRSC